MHFCTVSVDWMWIFGIDSQLKMWMYCKNNFFVHLVCTLFAIISTPSPLEERSIVASMSVWVSVCEHILGTFCSVFTKFCACHLQTWRRGSVLLKSVANLRYFQYRVAGSPIFDRTVRFFTARCYACTVQPWVCVCLSPVGVLLKRLG